MWDLQALSAFKAHLAWDSLFVSKLFYKFFKWLIMWDDIFVVVGDLYIFKSVGFSAKFAG